MERMNERDMGSKRVRWGVDNDIKDIEGEDGGKMVRRRVVSSGTCLGFMHTGSEKWV